MPKQKVTQERVDRLIEDATYLQKEAEALQYVIDEIPYNEKPPEGDSIAEMLLLIDHAQISYFQLVIEDAANKRRPTRLSNFAHFEETYHPDKTTLNNIQNLLHSLAKHRAIIVNKLKSISINDWKTVIYDDNQEILLVDFIQQMTRFDQIQLKKITKLVMAFNQEQGTRRKIKQRQMRQNSQSNND